MAEAQEQQQRRSSINADSSKAIDNLTPEELAELREAFRVFDQDGDVGENVFTFLHFDSLQGTITVAGEYQFKLLIFYQSS